jgi:preprotein translocase subunit SecF
MSGALSRLYHGETRFDFIGSRRRWFTFSAALLLVSVLALSIRGLNLGVDFEGGSLVEVKNPAAASVADVRDALTGIGLEGAVVQATGGGSGLRVQTKQLAAGEEDRLVEVLAQVSGSNSGEANRQTVGPTFGAQVTQSAIRALIVFLLVVSLFLWWRMEWKMALAAMAELIHDLVLTAGIYALIGFEVTPATVIALLTILGYSLYDTVVVFDKIEENVRERGERHTISALVNMSLNQVLMRSINTSLTTLLPIGSLLFVGSYLLGAATLREFALALFIGVATGTYSSIFLGAQLVAMWKEREERWRRVRRRLSRRVSDDEFATRGVGALAEAAGEVPMALVTGAVPRPPRKRRRSR